MTYEIWRDPTDGKTHLIPESGCATLCDHPIPITRCYAGRTVQLEMVGVADDGYDDELADAEHFEEACDCEECATNAAEVEYEAAWDARTAKYIGLDDEDNHEATGEGDEGYGYY